MQSSEISRYIAALPGRAGMAKFMFAYATLALIVNFVVGSALIANLWIAELLSLDSSDTQDSPLMVSALIAGCVLGTVIVWRLYPQLVRSIPAQREMIRENLIDKGLLQVVLSENPLDRLPSLVHPLVKLVQPAVRYGGGMSLRQRLDFLLFSYSACCHDLGISGPPPMRRAGRVSAIFFAVGFTLLLTWVMLRMAELRTMMTTVHPEPNLLSYLLPTAGMLLCFTPIFLFWRTYLNHIALNCALPLELAEILTQTPPAPPPPLN